MPSILAPKWLRPQNLYPHWMGLTEIEVTVTRFSGSGDGYDLSPTYYPRKKIVIYAKSIQLWQNDTVQELTPLFETKDLRKIKHFPEVRIDDVRFIKND